MGRPITRGGHGPTKYNVVAIPYNVKMKNTTPSTKHMYVNVNSLMNPLSHCPSIFSTLPHLLVVVQGISIRERFAEMFSSSMVQLMKGYLSVEYDRKLFFFTPMERSTTSGFSRIGTNHNYESREWMRQECNGESSIRASKG